MLAVAKNHKAKGNEHYQKPHFEEAIWAYNQALDAIEVHNDESQKDSQLSEDQESSTKDEVQALQTIVYSNRASCKLEQGCYADAVIDTREALNLIDSLDEPTEKSSALRAKNVWKLARALYYADSGTNWLNVSARDMNKSAYVGSEVHGAQDVNGRSESGTANECSETLRQMIEDNEQDSAFTTKAASLLKASKYRDTVSKLMAARKDKGETKRVTELDTSPTTYTSQDFRPQILRSTMQDPLSEYYAFGHDTAQSALEDVLSDDMNDTVSILYGGVGDGRHLLSTILDAAYRQRSKDKKQSRSSKEDKKRPSFKLQGTMNDVNSQILVKDILVLVLSQCLSELKSSESDASSDDCTSEYTQLLFVLYYGLLSHAMPVAVYTKLQTLLRELFIDNSCSDFCKTYPWLHVYERDWEAFRRIAQCWVDLSLYTYPLPTVKHALTVCMPKSVDPDAIPHYDPNDEYLASMVHQQELRKSYQRARVIESFCNVSAWPAHVRKHYETLPGGVPSPKQAREMCQDSEFVDDLLYGGVPGAVNKRALYKDKLFHQATGTFILPPADICTHMGGLEEELEMLDKCKIGPSSAEKDFRAKLKPFNAHVHKHWVLNPIKRDPDFPFNDDSDDSNYVVLWADNYYHESNRNMCGVKGSDVLKKMTLFECMTSFYVSLGVAITQLVSASKLTLEVSLGSVLDFGSSVRESTTARADSALPTAYDRVYLSNVPDYTGMLSTLVHIGFLLNTKTCSDGKALNTGSWLRSNVLMNTTLFEDFDAYVYGTLALTTSQIPRFLHMRVLNENPSTWAEFNTWGRDDRTAQNKPVSLAEFTTWLHRLFLVTVLPPERNPNVASREELPNTVGLYLQTCRLCITDLGYPVHWVTAALDQLLDVSDRYPLKSKIVDTNMSPSSIPREIREVRYNLTSFRLELENQLGLFIQSNLFADCLLSTQHLPTGKPVQYQVTTKAKWLESGVVFSSVMGMLLHSPAETCTKFGDIYNPLSSSRARELGSGSQLRKGLLQHGSALGHLLSCVEVQAKNPDRDNPGDGVSAVKLSFWMCEDVYEAHRELQISLVRTDSWICLEHDTISLRDATAVVCDR